MKPLSTFHVIPDLPDRLAPLWKLAHNLWWCWNQEAIRTWTKIDPDAWTRSGRNPLRLLSFLDQEQLDRLADDDELGNQIEGILEQFHRYRDAPTWFQERHGDETDVQIAYFSLEFGLTESLPIYSGGMGVLAGDYLKAASDLGLPMIGVGLLYRQGYFKQSLNPDGWQLELYPENDFDQLPVNQVQDSAGDPLVIEVSLPHGGVSAQIWSVEVGRTTLYLLDTNIDQNSPEDQSITAILYGGDGDMRIRQEILLGIGGLRALHALGVPPSICHMNEGHSAFQALERIRIHMAEEELSFDAAREASSAGNIFTTHTPVAAGTDWFPPDLVESYFRSYREELGLSREQFLGLGRVDPEDKSSDFCMTVLALRLSAQSNGVSRLHGKVSRTMWAALWPGIAEVETPITSITNGVHTQSWASPDMADLLDRTLGDRWRYTADDGAQSEAIRDIPDGDLWAVRQYRRRRLIERASQHLANQFRRQGMPTAKIDATLGRLDPEALTIGFARRFATYKRGNLILKNPDRLAALLGAQDRPLQILFGGKAHPHDHAGKELIREIVHLSRREPFAGRIFFLEDYDMSLARYLVQGSDVWLNTPRRPQEASGTSGMKAALNGSLNISVLDGWWDEACEIHPGWAIGHGEVYEDLGYQDEVESNALYDLLESEVIPLFYARDEGGMPVGWVSRVKEALAALVPEYSSNRMICEYLEQLYLPNHARWRRINSDRERLNELSQWKKRVSGAWSQVAIERVESQPPTQPTVGVRIPLEVTVQLGNLSPGDVRVELYCGRVNAEHEIEQGETIQLSHLGVAGDGAHSFSGEYTCSSPGSHGYTIRVVPHHRDLRSAVEMGLVCWA